MKSGWDRHGRKDHPRRARALGERRSGHARIPALLAVVMALAFGASSAQAMTGGASPVATTGTVAGGAFAFSAMKTAGATWYGPGLYGNHTACGQTLLPQTIGVAHRSLPCGTAVKFNHQGRSVIARVIDRGPYSNGFSWDLTNGARRLLGFEGAGPIRYAVELKFARR